LERVFAFAPDTTPAQAQSVWYSVNGTYPEFVLAINRFQLTLLTDITKETAVFTPVGAAGGTAPSPETYPRDAFGTIWVCDPAHRGSISTGEKNFTPPGGNYRVMLYSVNATPNLAMIYKYN
jgi:hypothetical protein